MLNAALVWGGHFLHYLIWKTDANIPHCVLWNNYRKWRVAHIVGKDVLQEYRSYLYIFFLMEVHFSLQWSSVHLSQNDLIVAIKSPNSAICNTCKGSTAQGKPVWFTWSSLNNLHHSVSLYKDLHTPDGAGRMHDLSSCHCKILHGNTELLTYFYILLCFQEEINCEVSCCCKQCSSQRWREKKNPSFAGRARVVQGWVLGAAAVPKLRNLADLLNEVSPDRPNK